MATSSTSTSPWRAVTTIWATSVTPPSPCRAGTLHGVLGARGLNLDAVLSMPFTNKFSAFVRAGAAYTEVEGAFEGTGLVNVVEPNSESKEVNYKFGAGLEYMFTRRFGMRLEGERYRIDDSVGNKGDIDLYSAGVVFRFGAPPAAAYVAPPPPPPPVVQAPPPRRRGTAAADPCSNRPVLHAAQLRSSRSTRPRSSLKRRKSSPSSATSWRSIRQPRP